MKRNTDRLASNWTTWWIRAQRGLGLFEKSCLKHQQISLKEIPQAQLMRLKFSAYYDVEDVVIENIVIKDENLQQLIAASCTIKSQGELFLDEIDISGFDRKSLTIEYTIKNRCVSGFELMDYDEFVQAPKQIYALSQIDLYSDELSGCICVFGDSIVEQAHYVRLLRQKLRKQGFTVLNLGISGNRLLSEIKSIDLSKTENEAVLNSIASKSSIIEHISLAHQCFGAAGIHRFKNEVLGCLNVKRVIVAIGVNDLYQPDTFCARKDELPTLEMMLEGYRQLKEQSPASCLFCTITSFESNPHFSLQKQKLRKQVNQYLEEHYDTVAFDAILTERKQLFNEDMLHPNPMGGMLMAKEILKWLSSSCA